MGSPEEYIVITSEPIGDGSTSDVNVVDTPSSIDGKVAVNENADNGSSENVEYVEVLAEPPPDYIDVLDHISFTLDALFILLAFLAGMFFFRCFGK